MGGKKNKKNKAQKAAEKRRAAKRAAHASVRRSRPKAPNNTNDAPETTVVVTNLLKAGQLLTPALIEKLNNNPVTRQKVENTLCAKPIHHPFFVHIPSLKNCKGLPLNGWQDHEITTKGIPDTATPVDLNKMMQQVHKRHPGLVPQ